MDRQPKPGEWWFSPDGTERRYCVGVDTTGDAIWEVFDHKYTDKIEPYYVPVPDCTGWAWELPALPIGWELCNPPKDAVECTFLRVWDDDAWNWCHSDYINAVEYTFCRRPQKEPSSVAKIAAQLRQLAEELEVSDEA